MKLTNLEKRKKNGNIVTITTIVIAIIFSLLYISMVFLPLSNQIKIPLMVLCGVILLGVFAKFLLYVQNKLYDYLNRSIDEVEKNLTSSFRTIYLKKTDYLTDEGLELHKQRIYQAKLEDDETITILIKNEFNKKDNYIQYTSDYSWFLSLFKFEE